MGSNGGDTGYYRCIQGKGKEEIDGWKEGQGMLLRGWQRGLCVLQHVSRCVRLATPAAVALCCMHQRKLQPQQLMLQLLLEQLLELLIQLLLKMLQSRHQSC